LEILAGDEEEHSVMLANYFLGLGKKAWLLIGSSITNGLCAYVLLYEGGDYTIWYQGQPYKVSEPHNPVRVVSALVSPDNMWFNVQQFEEPYRIQFDVNNSRYWRSFFTKKKPNMCQSIQPEKLLYATTNPKYVNELESKIERKLIDKLQTWRSHRRTRFYPLASNALRRVLLTIEKNRDVKLENQTGSDVLVDLQKSYHISGFPINMPYTTIEAILEAVYATQVHAIPSNEVEYAVAVNIYAYPNTILSVWVYVAVLTKKD
jgi:coiled-coil and C2 domain-containing protein 2A